MAKDFPRQQSAQSINNQLEKDKALLINCITWAIKHGYNPFDSTISLEARTQILLGALNTLA